MEVNKKSAGSAGPGCDWVRDGPRWQFSLQPPLIFLKPLDLQECKVPHLKDLIHISSEPEAQGCGMTFNRFYIGLKYPYFIPYSDRWPYFFAAGVW